MPALFASLPRAALHRPRPQHPLQDSHSNCCSEPLRNVSILVPLSKVPLSPPSEDLLEFEQHMDHAGQKSEMRGEESASKNK
jgi:hypothetical protein